MFLIPFAVIIFAIYSFSDNSKDDRIPLKSLMLNKGKPFHKIFKIPDLNFDGKENDLTPSVIYGSPYYTDNFDGANDTASLKARGYLVYYRGSGVQGIAPTWFQGDPFVFGSHNGPPNGYVAGIFQVATGANNIDNWLVLPAKNVSSTDSIFFYQRSQFDPVYPDSVRVMYSAVGDSVPEAGSWVELGRFRANYATNAWVRKGYKAPSAGSNARFALRYAVVNGGPGGVNSNYIGIDALTIESVVTPADVGMFSINSPSGNIPVASSPITPSVTVKNYGTTLQSFTVKMTIEPGGFSSTQNVPNVGAGNLQNVNFGNYNLALGTYTVKVFTQLASDANRANDTLTNTFSVIQPNYGGGQVSNGGYYFANSTSAASGAPSKPEYCRSDTAGSISLALNNTAKVSLRRGDLDDGHWALANLGGARKIKFMGTAYDSVFIGTNGLICFTDFIPDAGNWVPPVNGLPGNGSGGITRPGIYPLWSDLKWNNTDQPVNRLSYKADISTNRLIINFDRAPLYGGSASEFLTFQVVIEFQADTANAPDSKIVFNYDNSSTALSIPFLSGIQNNDGSKFVQYSFTNSGSVNVTPGILFNTVSSGVSVAFGPNVNGLSGSCNTLNLTALMQGFWNGTSNAGDTVTVQLRRITPPYDIAGTVKGKTNSSGNVILNTGNVSSGTPYYIVVKHRNSIQTWSRSGGETWTGLNLIYNFTTALTQAYGNNLKLKSGKYCNFGGDVNQDETVDASDLSQVDNDALISLSGYVLSDVTGDDFVDADDVSITDNNASVTVSVIRP